MKQSLSTTKPGIKTPIPSNTDPALRQVINEIGNCLGVCIIMQNEDGGQTPVRFNRTTGTMQWWDGSNWR